MNDAADSIWAAAEIALAADDRLGPIVRRVGRCRLSPHPPRALFAPLLEAIVYQQLNGRAAGTIHQRVLELFTDPAAPEPCDLAAISDEQLRAAGLSRGKLAAIRDLARHSLAGTLPAMADVAKLSDDELVARLTAVRGIGPWTVQMLLIFDLGRPDVWPASDFGIRTAVQRLWRKRALPEPQFMARVARAWRPWRSVASWYLWRSLESVDAPPA